MRFPAQLGRASAIFPRGRTKIRQLFRGTSLFLYPENDVVNPEDFEYLMPRDIGKKPIPEASMTPISTHFSPRRNLHVYIHRVDFLA